MPGPLRDIKVVELAGIGPGPHAGMILADLGAEVIQVVRPGGDGLHLPGAEVLDRGKRSVGIDLKHPEGVELALRLVARSDILIEGYRPGVTERLGLGPSECLRRNPRLVYGRMTGWGQTGPLAPAAGHDIDYIAVAGALGSIGTGERPVPPLNLVGDFGGGSMLLVIGVLAALHPARATGVGQVVDAAMVDGVALLMAMQHGLAGAGMWSADRETNLLDGSAPFYSVYETADSEWMAVGALEPQFYAELLEGLGLSEEAPAAQYDRSQWDRLRRVFADRFRQRTRADWEDVFSGRDACVSGVYSLAEAPRHSHLVARGTFVEVAGAVQPAPAPRFDRTPAAAPGLPPSPGADTEAVLDELGVAEAEISRLARQGVIHGIDRGRSA